MKRILLQIILAFACSQLASAQVLPGYSELYESQTAHSLREHVSYLACAALEGRGAGTEGETEAARYFEQQLRSMGIDILTASGGELFGLKQENGDTLTSRNVVGVIQGYDKSLNDNYIVIGARLDNMGSYTMTVNGEPVLRTFYGANGNASGLAVLLELASRLSINRSILRRSVLIAGFGSSLKIQAGSWYFVNRYFSAKDKLDAMVNIDMVGIPSQGFYAYTSANADMASYVNSLATTLQPVQPKLVDLEPCASDHRSFYNSQIPSVFFTTGRYPEYNTDKDTPSILEYSEMEKIVEYLYNFCVELARGPKPSFSDRQLRVEATPEDAIPFYECDYLPTFMGSNNPNKFLEKHVYTYLRYPQRAVEQGIQGRVLVGFVIDEKGRMTDVKVLKGVHPLLDEEAVRVIKASPDWKPGRVKGTKVKTSISIYVDFKLARK